MSGDDNSYISEVRINGRIIVEADSNRTCEECGKPGAAPIGICIDCATKAMSGKKLKSAAGKTYAKRLVGMGEA